MTSIPILLSRFLTLALLCAVAVSPVDARSAEASDGTTPAHRDFDLRRLSLEWEEYEHCLSWHVSDLMGSMCTDYEIRTRFHVFSGAGRRLTTGRFALLVDDEYTLRVYRRKRAAAFVGFGSMIAGSIAMIAGSRTARRQGEDDLGFALGIAAIPTMSIGITLLILVPIKLSAPSEFFDISDADILIDRYNDDLCAEVGLSREECRRLDRRVTAPIEHP